MKVKSVLIISDDSLERLGELNFIAKKFVKEQQNIDAVIFTNKDDIAVGFNKIYGIKDPPANAIEPLFSIAKNYDLILTNGVTGATIGGLLAYKLRSCCVFGVNEIDYDEFIFSHSAYGDKAIIEYKPTCLPLLVVTKEKYFDQELPENKAGRVEWIKGEGKVEVLKEEPVIKEVEIDKAKVVVGGGRGVGSKDGFEVLKHLANLLGGVVGASRAAVDNGWMPHQYQVGQSGAILTANLYFAFGISGATQHLSGIKNVKCVVAINIDEEAPIFKRARYNIVADWKEFATALINQLEESNG